MQHIVLHLCSYRVRLYTDLVHTWYEISYYVNKSKLGLHSGNFPNYLFLSPQLGGTIGDIEGMPFVEAFRQFQFRVGHQNFTNIHVSLVPQVSTCLLCMLLQLVDYYASSAHAQRGITVVCLCVDCYSCSMVQARVSIGFSKSRFLGMHFFLECNLWICKIMLRSRVIARFAYLECYRSLFRTVRSKI